MLSVTEAKEKLDTAVEKFNAQSSPPTSLEEFKQQIVKRLDLALAHDNYARVHFPDFAQLGSSGSFILTYIWETYSKDKELFRSAYPSYSEAVAHLSMEEMREEIQ